MMRTLAASLVALAATVSTLFCGPAADATTIDPGVDLLTTLPGSQWDFQLIPLPADFFGPGSDPFFETVPLQGVPIGPGNTDTIVERFQGIDPFPENDPTVKEIPIEIVQLHLVSTSPITVTFNGGQDPEQWQLDIVLPPTPQPLGAMRLDHQAADGGVFQSDFVIEPRFVFTRLEFTPGSVEFQGQPIDFSGTEAAWLHTPHPNDAHTPLFPAGDFHAPAGFPVPWYGVFPIDPVFGRTELVFASAVIPEPSTAILALFGIAATWMAVRRI